MKTSLKQYIAWDRHLFGQALMIIVPVLLQSIINQGVNMMDTIMVGSLGEVSISASSLANQFYNIYTFWCMGLSAAGLVLTAQYFGQGDKETVKRVLDLLIQIITVTGLLFGIGTMLFARQIMAIYIDDARVIEEGVKYLRITAFVYLPHGLSLIVSNLMRSVGNARIGLYVSLTSFLVNLAANYIFIFGKLGFAPMGVAGAALGTLCARIVEFTVCAIFVLKIDKCLEYRLTRVLRLPKRLLVGEFVRLGIPAIVSDMFLAFASSAIGIILGHMGKEYVTAYSIVTVVDRMCTIASLSVASAAGILVGQAIGAGEHEEAKRRGVTFLLLSAAIGLVGSVLVVLVGDWSISLYDIAPHTVEITKSMMLASALVLTFQNIQTTLGKGILRGGGDTKFLMISDIILQWFTSIPLGYLAGTVFHASAFLVLISVKIDYVIKSIFFMRRLLSNRWMHSVKHQSPSVCKSSDLENATET